MERSQELERQTLLHYACHDGLCLGLHQGRQDRRGFRSVFSIPRLQCPPLPPPRPSKGRREIRWKVRCRLGSIKADQVCQATDHWFDSPQVQAFPESRSRTSMGFDQGIRKEMGSGPDGGVCRHDRRRGPEYRPANRRLEKEKGLRQYAFSFLR